MGKAYDFICIGGGSAGYNAARVAAGLGLKTAVVEGARQMGGLCILRGCMPSKTLLYAAEILHHARHAGDFGLKVAGARADMKAVQSRKRRIIGEFADYRVDSLEAGKFDLFRGKACFTNERTVKLEGGESLQGSHFLIATGSEVSFPPVPGLDGIGCWTSDDVLELDRVPKSVLVLGGGIVACELAQFLARIGTRVVMLQRGGQLLGGHSGEGAEVVREALAGDGIEIYTGTRIVSLKRGRGGVTATFACGERTLVRRAEHCLNALGRQPCIAGLGLAAAGVKTGENGGIVTNRWQQTSVKHIYAAGDCAGPHEIVHLAVAQGELSARHAAGVKGLRPVAAMPLLSVVFTDPQLACIGATEMELGEKGIPFLKASYPFSDHGKSILMGATRGHVTVLAEPGRGRILGVEIAGKDAGELIHCFSTPMTMKATVKDMLAAPWYHPTMAEIVTYPLEEIAEQLEA